MTATATEPVAATRSARWAWAAVVVLIALWTVAHIGCHRDEDTELSVPRPMEHGPRPSAANTPAS